MDLLCPHFCRGCGELGTVLCERCKNNILAGERVKKQVGAGAQMVAVGWREGLLEELVESYKYAPVRAMGGVLAELLAAVIPSYAGEVVVVPLPTVAQHVRERGFDHMRLIGRRLARARGWRCERLLVRAKDTVQVGANRAERLQQAKGAYAVRPGVELDSAATYLLIDDVWTTGASLKEAARVLKAAGAQKIRLAAVAVSR